MSPEKPQPTARGRVERVYVTANDEKHLFLRIRVPLEREHVQIMLDDEVEVRTVSRLLPNDTPFTREDNR